MTLQHIDLTIKNGLPGKPGVILVHGLGMNRHFWTDPSRCQVLGGQGKMTLFLTGPPAAEEKGVFSFGAYDPDLTGLGIRFAEEGLAIASWSQRDPLGYASVALEELEYVVDRVLNAWPDRPVFIIGHSRGGVLARKYLLESGTDKIVGLVTICSPHGGTKMAGFAGLFRPLGRVLDKVLPREKRGAGVEAMKRFAVFLNSPAIKELQVDSGFFTDYDKDLPATLRQLSFNGTDPGLIRFYSRANTKRIWKEIIVTDILARAVPGERFPKELRTGYGDGLVSADSAVLSLDNHFSVARNHVGVAFDSGVHDRIVAFLGEIFE